ncbi:MAG: hypothetical protein ACTSRS_22805 [Candidatus Helarchaeota archaeon]
MTKEKSNEMSYEKCIACPFVMRDYPIGGGVRLVCMVTGKSIDIKECPRGEK